MIENYLVITTDDRKVVAKVQSLLETGAARLEPFTREMARRFQYHPFDIVSVSDSSTIASFRDAKMEFYQIEKGIVRKLIVYS